MKNGSCHGITMDEGRHTVLTRKEEKSSPTYSHLINISFTFGYAAAQLHSQNVQLSEIYLKIIHGETFASYRLFCT